MIDLRVVRWNLPRGFLATGKLAGATDGGRQPPLNKVLFN
jgi:hypothetical protein